MGLDMYLSAERCLSTYTDKDRDAHAKLVPFADALLPPPESNTSATIISRDVAYWRKANQIHNWFVTNVQEGKDDCGHYSVDRSKLEELRDICSKIVNGAKMKAGKINNGYTYENRHVTSIDEFERVISARSIAEAQEKAEALADASDSDCPDDCEELPGETTIGDFYVEDVEDTDEPVDEEEDGDDDE